jgi:asparagine synthase (glutamine-hydrolysing)
MCGISGWFQINSKVAIQDSALGIESMTTTIAHRGPDDRGVVVFDDAALGMTRLSIIDLAGGHQPMANNTEDCWIVFNGEIYNFNELREELRVKGHRFRSRSDTEVILCAYEEWGSDCVRRLRGMFALAIYDRRWPKTTTRRVGSKTSTLLLTRDRIGKKPLYYYRDEERLIFGSEIKVILAHPSVRRAINRSVIPLYLTHGYVPAPFTMFEDIYELPPGHTLTVRDGEVKVSKYWDLPVPESSDRIFTEKQYIVRLQELFEEAVRIRLISDVPLGAFLSGGLDSSAIVAVMSRLMDQPVKTFAIGFAEDTSFNELDYAREVANTYKTDHHEFVVKPDAIDLLPKLVWHHDQPFGDSSAIPTYLVAQMTREHVKVALTGDGSDELFAGYERFAAARLAESFRRVPRFLQDGMAQLLGALPESTAYNGFVRRARRFVESAPLPLAERYLQWVGMFRSEVLRELFTDVVDIDPEAHFRTYFDSRLDNDPIAQLLSVNMKSYLPGDLLVKTDRMTMANSLEARSPFLDQELLQFAVTIPTDLKLKGRTTKYILKRALEGIVPRKIIQRKKHGFGVPVGHWFRTNLREYVRDTILAPDALQRGYFKEETLRRLVDEHQTGKRDHGHRLWTLLTFEIWHQLFIDQEVGPWLPIPHKTKSEFYASSGA